MGRRYASSRPGRCLLCLADISILELGESIVTLETDSEFTPHQCPPRIIRALNRRWEALNPKSLPAGFFDSPEKTS